MINTSLSIVALKVKYKIIVCKKPYKVNYVVLYDWLYVS